MVVPLLVPYEYRFALVDNQYHMSPIQMAADHARHDAIFSPTLLVSIMSIIRNSSGIGRDTIPGFRRIYRIAWSFHAPVDTIPRFGALRRAQCSARAKVSNLAGDSHHG